MRFLTNPWVTRFTSRIPPMQNTRTKFAMFLAMCVMVVVLISTYSIFVVIRLDTKLVSPLLNPAKHADPPPPPPPVSDTDSPTRVLHSVPENYYYVSDEHDANSAEHTNQRANATFIILARNSELEETKQSIQDIEEKFNARHGYPYVFLNDEEFSEDFKTQIRELTQATVEFGVIPHDHWYQPDWVDEGLAKSNRDALVAQDVIYGGSVSYRNMCRFNSGFFFRHPLVQKYRWYWRIEPNVHFYCDLNFDPFVYLQNEGKVYGFTVTMYEFEKTIPTLWKHVRDFVNLHPEYLAKDNALDFMSEDNGKTYNLCHFWSNFEIADMDFWRSPAYTDFFDYLDDKGGFYYERWGDAPVHSIAVALFASRSQIHFFDEIGYQHLPFTHCPIRGNNHERGNCGCSKAMNFDYNSYSCLKKWEHLILGS